MLQFGVPRSSAADRSRPAVRQRCDEQACGVPRFEVPAQARPELDIDGPCR